MLGGSSPSILESTDVEGIAKYIKSPHCKKICFLTGAGVSVAAGIPDFRSPGGMYATLQPDLLTATPEQRATMRLDPTSVVSWPLFRENQFPYLELRRPFILGLAEQKWKATISHWFVQLCEEKGLLLRLYTQNIDGLDFQTNIPSEKIIGAHGTLGKIACEFCESLCDINWFRDEVRTKIKDIYQTDPEAPQESSPVLCPSCDKPGLKPMTVLYGSSLPAAFFECCSQDFPYETDLLIVAGTSLTVGPANGVVSMVRCPRVIVNNEPVGKDLGIQYGKAVGRDAFIAGTCDEGFLKLTIELGWFGDLLKYYDQMSPDSQALLDKSKAEQGI